jgi:SAM-dependent methyltransferase
VSDDLRESYDRLASEYTRRIAGELEHKPFDRDLLDAFAARHQDRGTVLDLGCGPGHVAAYLKQRGVDVVGIDLSPRMVEEASALNPGIEFRAGDMTKLELSEPIGGIVAFYSIIHIPRERHAAMFANWRQALSPGGEVLHAFHTGGDDRHLEQLWEVPIEIDFLFFTPEEIETALRAAGFEIVSSTVRDPYPGVEAETRRCYLLARSAS